MPLAAAIRLGMPDVVAEVAVATWHESSGSATENAGSGSVTERSGSGSVTGRSE